MIIANNYEVPNKCPNDCKFLGENTYQGSICTRCPIFCCKDPIIDKIGTKEYERYGGPMIRPEDYRSDWALEWELFFKDGTIPILPLIRIDTDKGG